MPSYTSVSLDDDKYISRIDKLRKEKQAAGGKWERPDVIGYLLDFHDKYGIDNNVNKETTDETTTDPKTQS